MMQNTKGQNESCALGVGGAYSVSPVNHNDTSQSKTSVISCMRKTVDRKLMFSVGAIQSASLTRLRGTAC